MLCCICCRRAAASIHIGRKETKMNGYERVIKALKLEEPDRVPTFEWEIDKKVINAITPGKTISEFVYAMDIDGFCADLNYKTEKIDETLFQDEWGIVKRDTGEAHTFPVDGPIKSKKDLDKYIPPDPKDPERYRTLENYLRNYGKDKAVILHLNDVWSIPSRLMPFEDFILNIVEEPDFIKALVNMAVDVNIEMAKEAVKRGARIAFTGDDFAYNSGPLCSPGMFKEIFAPALKRCVHAYKDLGLYVIKHTDGNIMPIIDMIVDAGFDCLDPIDPIAGMDLEFIKKKYGRRIAIKGNVNCAYTLATGTVEETIVETKKCLKIAAPGGGYILSSSNSIHSSVKPENYIAMLDTLKEFGTYPLAV